MGCGSAGKYEKLHWFIIILSIYNFIMHHLVSFIHTSRHYRDFITKN